MGNLALAGAVSGMGQGLERGLNSLQTGIIQHGLQDSEHTFQSEKLKEQLAHAEAIQEKGLLATASENKLTRDQQTEEKTKDRTLSATQHGETVALGEKKLAHDIESDTEKNRIAAETGKAHQGYYQAYADYLKGGGKSGASGAKIDLDMRKAGADFFSKRIAPLEKQLIDPLTSKEERVAIQERIEALSKEGLGILGFTFGKESEGYDIVDPLGDLSPAGGIDKAKDVKAPGPTATVTKPRGERSVAAPSAPSAGPLEALRGGAGEASQGLLDMATPYSKPSDVTIEKRKRQ